MIITTDHNHIIKLLDFLYQQAQEIKWLADANSQYYVKDKMQGIANDIFNTKEEFRDIVRRKD